jgi:hypothetical protein
MAFYREIHLKIVESRVSVLNSDLQQIGPEVVLDSIRCRASRWINGVWVKIGPETKDCVQIRRDFCWESPCARACEVVRLRQQLGLARSIAACVQPGFGPQPNTILAAPLSAHTPPRINPNPV